MKVLTVWQPWASLIIEGAKPYEFRGWKPPSFIVGQRIVIHAAKRKLNTQEVEDLIFALELGCLHSAMTCLRPKQAYDLLKRALTDGLPTACGLGTAIVGEGRNGVEIAEEFGVPRANDSDRDDHANWGWPMLEIERWDEPIPAKGMQGLWTWPTPEAVAL